LSRDDTKTRKILPGLGLVAEVYNALVATIAYLFIVGKIERVQPRPMAS
jgi:hypothetical protein